MQRRMPTHPGEMLLEEFLKPTGITQSGLAEAIGVGFRTVNEVINQKRGVSPEFALRLARFFGTTPEFWLNGQRELDLYNAERKAGTSLKAIKPWKKSA